MTEFDTSLERLVARVHPVLDAVTMAGGQPTIVGGAVRDALLGLMATEIDIEASGLSIEALSAALSSVGRTNIVGQAFGVLRVDIPGVGTFDV